MKNWIITNSVLAAVSLAVLISCEVTGAYYAAGRVSSWVLMFAAGALTYSVLAVSNQRAERAHLARLREARFAPRDISKHRLMLEREREAMQRLRTPQSGRIDAILATAA